MAAAGCPPLWRHIFLFVMWEGGGNVPPMLGLARRLVQCGHAVRVISDPANGPEVRAAGCEFTPYRRAPHRMDKSAARTCRFRTRRCGGRASRPMGRRRRRSNPRPPSGAQDLAGSGVTVNALLPGGATLTGMIPNGYPAELRAKLLPPEVMVPRVRTASQACALMLRSGASTYLRAKQPR